MKLDRLPPLLLAAFLQFAPAVKILQSGPLAGASAPLAIVLRWAAAVAAMAGAYHTVSGASAAVAGLANLSPPGPITTNATGQVGQPFQYRIIVTNPGVNPQQAYYNAGPLPPGLTINTNVGGNGVISGTPTAAGVYFPVRLTAGNLNYPTPVFLDVSLTIQGTGSAPSITGPPASQTVVAGATVTFSVTATGAAPITYQWAKATVPIPSATSPTLRLTAVQTTDAGTYTVTVTNPSGSTSASATLTVNPAPTAPTITTHPQNLTVTEGDSASFTVVATGTAPLAYQWLKDTVPINSATAATFTLAGAQLADAGGYAVRVSNTAGTNTSLTATLTVLPVATPPNITGQPTNLTVRVGEPASFSVTATGTAPLAYQWLKDTVPINGATAATFSLAGAQLADAGGYAVRVSNTAGTNTSLTATLTVVVPPSILTQPQSLIVTNGGTASFSVVASGTAPLGYRWKLQGTPLPGATAPTLVITNVQPADGGDYTVDVTNAVDTVTSLPAHLTVQVPSLADLTLSAPQWINGHFEFEVTGPIQTNYVLWSSAGLTTWTALQTNFTVDGVVHFSDTNPPAGSTGFYRATVGP